MIGVSRRSSSIHARSPQLLYSTMMNSSKLRLCPSFAVFLLLTVVLEVNEASFFGATVGRSAKVLLTPAGESGVSGELIFEQPSLNGPVLIRGFIKGLKHGSHGFHIHTKGQLGNNCVDAGPHFNPFKARFLSFPSVLQLCIPCKRTYICLRYWFQKKHGDPSVQKFFRFRPFQAFVTCILRPFGDQL